MGEFRGTKGKWVVYHLPASNFSYASNQIQYGGHGECVAEYVENNYDALLISKAPEMLEMLKSILASEHLKGTIEESKVKQLIKEATEL